VTDRPLDLAVATERVSRAGGQERVACELIARWAQRHRVTLYCYEAAPDLAEMGVRVVPVRPAPRGNLAGAVAFPWLVARRIRPGHDIVLAHGGNTLACDFSLFHTCHPLRLETMFVVARERGRPLSARERVTATVRRQVFIPFERRTLRMCPDTSFAVSQRMAQDLERVHGLAQGSVRVAPNGVDLGTFSPAVRAARAEVRAQLGVAEGDLLALFIGGIWWEKGVHVALRAVAAARSVWKLAVVGSDQDEASFRRMAVELGIGERVIFAGRTPQPQGFYGAADCLVLPSRFEGLPLVGIEAAACGLPVLISREGNPGGLFEGGVGYILEREPALFAAALDGLAADPERRERMGAAAAEKAKEFTWERQAAILEEAFCEYVAAR
jgi:glycosyltransferase involved in cell wall biosynthesis